MSSDSCGVYVWFHFYIDTIHLVVKITNILANCEKNTPNTFPEITNSQYYNMQSTWGIHSTKFLIKSGYLS